MMAAAVSEDKVGEIDGLLWLGSLHQISGIVLGERGLRRALYELCETLGSRHGVKRGRALALRDGLVHIDVAYGVEEPSGAVPLRTAKRMMDRAIDEARPIAMTGSEERPFGRANADSGRVRGDMTFICVPIRLDSEIVGALGIDACFETEAEYLAGCWSMEIVAAMVAHKIKIAWGVAGAKLPAGDSGALGAQRIRGHIDEPTVIRNSAVVRPLHRQVMEVARNDATVLIRGEQGAGQDLVAEAIHFCSGRAQRSLVRVSCATLQGFALELELFGCEKDAFVGAGSGKKGGLALADGGTLILDEIGRLDAAAQVKVTRVLEHGQFERIGGVGAEHANVRLLALTSDNLDGAVASGQFRSDLFAHLAACAITVPALRDRKPEIPLLVQDLLEKFANKQGRTIAAIAPSAMNALVEYDWPGNMCELESVLEQAVSKCHDEIMHRRHLPSSVTSMESGLSLKDTVASLEKDLIQDALKAAHGNRSKAARLLQTTERILTYKMRRYGQDMASSSNL